MGDVFRISGPMWGEATSPLNSPHKGPLIRGFDISFVVSLNRPLKRQSRDLRHNDAHVTILDKYTDLMFMKGHYVNDQQWPTGKSRSHIHGQCRNIINIRWIGLCLQVILFPETDIQDVSEPLKCGTWILPDKFGWYNGSWCPGSWCHLW